jgi:uncharacterized protein
LAEDKKDSGIKKFIKGLLAQLVEHRVCNAEVKGSSPLQSTKMNFPRQGLNPKIEVRITPSKGRGLFAKEKIFKGEIIENDEEALKDTQILTKEQIADKENSELWKSLCYEISDTEEICPKDIYNPPAGFLINHSCDPNTGVGENMIALRDIEAGEEITYDYAMTDAGNYNDECLCGSEKCRGRRRGIDWMIPELQKRYKGYFQKNIQKKIDALNLKRKN